MKIINKILAKVHSILKGAYHANLYDSYRTSYNIHESFFFNGEGILFYGDGEINIAENSYIGRFSIIQIGKGEKVEIGKNCSIGPFLKIWTNTAEVDSDFNFPDKKLSKFGSVIIKDAVWIGANVFISPGVTIGSNAVVGANAVVTKDVPDFAIVGGIPAKVLRFKNINKYGDFDKST